MRVGAQTVRRSHINLGAERREPFGGGPEGAVPAMAGSQQKCLLEEAVMGMDRPEPAERLPRVRPLDGVVADALTRVAPSVVAWHQPAGACAESLRGLLYRLLRGGENAPPRVLAITSARPGEGRTWMALNLAFLAARELAKTGQADPVAERPDVALVEADLRAPDQARLLGLEPGPGLAAVLEGATEPEAALRRLAPAGLWWLSAGEAVEEPSRLLAVGRGGDERAAGLEGMLVPLFERLGAACRLVVVDAPPLNAPEAQLVLPHVDGVLLVARAGTTDRGGLEDVWRARPAGVNWLGAVLTGATEDVAPAGRRRRESRR